MSAAASALSSALRRRGAAVTVLGLADALWDKEQSGWQGSSTEACRVIGPPKLGFAPSLSRKLWAAQPDIVHSHGLWMHPSRDVILWGRATGRPYLVSPHGMLDPWAVANSRMKKRAARWLFEGSHLGGAACLHALCEAEAGSIRAHGLKNPICVIPNGVTPSPEGSRSLPPWEGRLPGNSRILLYLGRLHPKKNLAALIDAAALAGREMMAESGHPWKIVIAGPDQLGQTRALETLAGRYRLQDQVLFTGPLFGEAKDAALSHASAFILPSVSEGLPMAVLEAWSYGLPVLMTSACNLPEGFSAGAALEISPEAEPMSAQLAAFFRLDGEVLRDIGERGRKLVDCRFAWDRVSEETIRLYAWLLGEADPPESVQFDGQQRDDYPLDLRHERFQ